MRTRAVRTPNGFRLDVLEPDPGIDETDATPLASFDCPLRALLRLTSGKSYRAERASHSLEIAVQGPLVEVRYEPGDGNASACETFRRDYLGTLMRVL